MTFDRLIYIDRLRSSGVDEQVARAHADALQDALSEAVASKADVLDVARELRAALDTRFAAVDRRFAAVDARFDGVESRFVGIDTRFAQLETKLENKIEIVARDLTIKGAGGLVVIAGIMIGLKVFG